MSSKKSSMTPILIGGGLIAIYLATKPKTKTSSSTTPKDDVPSLPPNPDIAPQIPADLTQKEKAYVDWYYNLGMYKLAQIDTNQIVLCQDRAMNRTIRATTETLVRQCGPRAMQPNPHWLSTSPNTDDLRWRSARYRHRSRLAKRPSAQGART